MQQCAGIDHLTELFELKKGKSTCLLHSPVQRFWTDPFLLRHILQRNILSRGEYHFLNHTPHGPLLSRPFPDFLIGVPAVISVQLQRLVLNHIQPLKPRLLLLTKKAFHQRLHLFPLFPGELYHRPRIIHQPGVGMLRMPFPAHIHKKPDVEPDHRHIELLLHRLHMVEVMGIQAEQTARHRVVGIPVYRYGALSGQHIEELHPLMEIRFGRPVDASAFDPDLLLHIIVIMVDARIPVILLFHMINLTLYDFIPHWMTLTVHTQPIQFF